MIDKIEEALKPTLGMTFMSEEEVKALYVECVATKRNKDGRRYNRHHFLTEDEIEIVLYMADSIGIPAYDEDVLIFNEYEKTAYHGDYGDDDFVAIAGDIFPDLDSDHPTDLLTIKAVLAHEWYGHRSFKGTHLPPGHWMDECRASYYASIITPNLDDNERRGLILDAKERIKKAGKDIDVSAILEICEKEEEIWKQGKK
jgi:hypothetical protein